MKQISDQELISNLFKLAHCERVLLGEVLRHLRELELRKLYVPRGHPSLFEFCLKELGFSENEAHARIQTLRLSKVVPDIEKWLEEGAISLSACAMAQMHFRRDEKLKKPVPPTIQEKIVKELCGLTKRQAEKKLAEYFPSPPPREKVSHLGNGKVKVEFTIEEHLWNRLQELFSIRTHVNTAKRWDKMIEDMTKLAWKKWCPYARSRPFESSTAAPGSP